VRTGEGVVGLRRELVLAGAKTRVPSLWKGDDLATAILMERFSDGLLNRGLAREESLQSGQLYTRDVTIGRLKERWFSEGTLERLAGEDERARHRLRELAQRPADDGPFRQPYYMGRLHLPGPPLPAAQALTGAGRARPGTS
jgi:CHAT domain-containing protein